MRKQKRGAPANRSMQYWHGPNYLLQHILETNGYLNHQIVHPMPSSSGKSIWQRIKGFFK